MRIFALLFFFFIYFNLDGQTQKSYSSRWYAADNKAITDPDEYIFNKKSKLYFIISNDFTNIYITLKVEDKVVISRILQEGLTVWVDMDNKLEKNMGIRFPVGPENIENLSTDDFSEKSTDADKDIAEAIKHANTIELIGFRNEPDKRFPAENSDTFTGTIKNDKNGVLHYLLIMPVEKIPVRNSRSGSGAMPFTIGVEYGNIASSNKTGKKDSKRKPAVISSQSGNPPVITWIKNVKLAEEK